MPFESSDLKNPILYPVTQVTSNKSWYLKKYQLCRKYFCIRPCIHSPSTRMGGKSKLRKASLPLVMHLKLDFSSTVMRVTLEWLWCKYIRNYLLVYQLISHFLPYLRNYKEFEGEISDLQLEKYGLSFETKKYTTSGWARGDENVIGIRAFNFVYCKQQKCWYVGKSD